MTAHQETEGRVAFSAGDPRPDPGPKRDGWDDAQSDLCRRNLRATPPLTHDDEIRILRDRVHIFSHMAEAARARVDALEIDLLATRSLLDGVMVYVRDQRDTIERLQREIGYRREHRDQCEAKVANLAKMMDIGKGD